MAKRDAPPPQENTGSPEASGPVDPRSSSGWSNAARRFVASMQITYEMWHDGTGYDLEALGDATPGELAALESLLIAHQPRDWRDVEALARIDSPRAREAVAQSLLDPDPKVRREAMRHAAHRADPVQRERLLLDALARCQAFDGLAEAMDEVEQFHPSAAIDALLRGARDRDGRTAVHFAAMLLYLHGKAPEPFDWAQRSFFLRFATSNRTQRIAALADLCRMIGVDVTRYVPSP